MCVFCLTHISRKVTDEMLSQRFFLGSMGLTSLRSVRSVLFMFTQHFVSSPLFSSISPSLYTCSSGSHIENWHSVLRNGLVNASYTKLQVRNPGSWLEFTMHLLSDSKPAPGRGRLAVRLIHFCS